MGMFLNYHNIADNYTPNNLVKRFPTGKSYTKLCSQAASKPYEEYDIKGNLIGYYWHYQQTLNLEFNIDGEITIESDALVLTTAGETPDIAQGTINQRAYNIVDLRSWTCTAQVGSTYVWTEDSEFTYDENGTKDVYISAEDYLKDKYVQVTIYNFRMNPIHTQKFKGSPKVILAIDKELSQKMTCGVYYCEAVVFDDDVTIPVFTKQDCIFNVR